MMMLDNSGLWQLPTRAVCIFTVYRNGLGELILCEMSIYKSWAEAVRFWEVRPCLSKLNKSTKLGKFTSNPTTTQWELPDSETVNGFVRSVKSI